MNLGILKTLKCNALCAHCGVSAGPQINSELPVDFCLNIIREASKHEFDSVSITGGESMLNYAEVMTLSKSAQQYGMKVELVTNGFWAKDNVKTKMIINDLVNNGVSQLTVSFDLFHQKYIPLKNIINIVDESQNFENFNLVLFACHTDSIDNHSLCSTLKNINKSIKIESQPVVPFGRAKNINLKKYKNDNKQEFEVPCLTDGGIFVDTSGDVYPCCNIDIDVINHPLKLGNLKIQNLSEILDEYKNNILLNTIFVYGPLYLAKKLNMNLQLDEYFSLCHLCNHVVSEYSYAEDFSLLYKEKLIILREIRDQNIKEYLKTKNYGDNN